MKRQKIMNIASARGGFSILELMVVIVVAGIIASLVAVNWNSFVRHQEVRKDANTFHKELLALKARAVENAGEIVVRYTTTDYTITTYFPDSDDPAETIVPKVLKTVSLTGNVTIESGGVTCDDSEDSADNKWKSDSISIKPDNINAFEDGCVDIVGNKGKSKYRIIKNKSIKPELIHIN